MKAVILGNIYDPDTDTQIVLLRVQAIDFDSFKRETEDW